MTSDLFRAQQTAHAFADILGLPVTCDQRLRERSFGEWEGMTRAEIKAVAADDYASWKQHTGAKPSMVWKAVPPWASEVPMPCAHWSSTPPIQTARPPR